MFISNSLHLTHSATKKTYKVIKSNLKPEDDHGKDSTGKAPVKKKPRVKKISQDAENDIQVPPKRRRLRGFLERVSKTPLDIFSNLDLLDLLQLSRTTKDLRAVLLRRSATFVWKRARQNIEGLPPLPDDLSEPKYAYLAFDNHCTNCLRHTTHVQWESRTKYLYTRYYYEPAINALREESKSLRDQALDSWVSSKRAAYRTLQSNARICNNWFTSTTSAPRGSQRNYTFASIVLQTHFEHFRVIERLTALGWGEEVQRCELKYELRNHKLVWQPRLLTERAWSAMSDTLISLAEEHKANRVKRDMVWTIHKRARLFASTYSDATRDIPLLPMFPKAVDAALLNPFSKIMFATPLDQDITESLKAALVDLPEVAAEWRETQASGLKGLLEKAGFKPDLNLATSFFDCNCCHHLFQYPYVLAHRCALQYTSGDAFDPKDWTTYALTRISPDPCVAWSASHFTVNGEALTRVQDIIRTCCLNPDTATREDMDSLECRVICNHCSNTSKFVMQWNNAACHQDHSSVGPHSWRLLDDGKELERVKSLEREKKGMHHCKVLIGRRGSELEEHLREVHNIKTVSSYDWDRPVNTRCPGTNAGSQGIYLSPRVEEQKPSTVSEETDGVTAANSSVATDS
ncbi:uncharacterized protein EV420DRAFT_1743970 [Desarmillaria tabescens]|uniref:F-box domain-containing protein n=1 Tax=Armillaria tabescens TaxID=1929756 RepID=A0AA39NIH0_ARMTA|nr:uncharacterized protein EV420DRAFT_1743970 [Desarmillaria tabescens]KAK0466144.1 hypothetical protein EV420DRAFT_1743970 [Desarmillaria tabescens]